MSKLTKQELLNRISESIKDNDDLVISLMEDVSDSFPTDEVDETMLNSLKDENSRLKVELEETKQRYKERFLSGETKEKEEIEEPEIKEVIDIKEI